MVQVWDPVISTHVGPLFTFSSGQPERRGAGSNSHPQGKMAPQKGRCSESRIYLGKVTPTPARPGSAPPGLGDSPQIVLRGTTFHLQGWLQSPQPDGALQCAWRREEIDKASWSWLSSQAGEWKEGGRWWSTLKSGDLSLYPGQSSVRTPRLNSSPHFSIAHESLTTILRTHLSIHSIIHPSILLAIHLSILPSIHSSLHPSMHPSILSSLHSLFYPFIHLVIHSFTFQHIFREHELCAWNQTCLGT